MGLEQLIQDGPTGLVKGYMGGATAGTDMRSKLAQAAFTDTQRNKMEQMMPHEVETARIANLPGQAQEQAGFYEQDAQTKTDQSKVSALQAQQAFRQMPEKERREMADSIKQQSLDAVSQLSKMLRGGAPVADAIVYAEQQYPAAAKDPSWKAQAQKYLNMPPDQAANEVDMLRHKIANTDFLAQMEGQKAVALKDMDNAAAMERAKYTADAGVRSAQIGAESRATAASSSINPTEAMLQLQKEYIAAVQAGDQKTAEVKLWQMNALSKSTPDQPSLIPGMGKQGRQIDPLGAVNTSKIPPAKIMMLQQDSSPKMRKLFDEAFGEGAAQAVLGK